MEPISIKKTLDFINYGIEIKYEGIPKDDSFDSDKTELLLEGFINNRKHNSMMETVAIVRTMFRDCEEKLLEIRYRNEKEEEFVKYKSSDLLLYTIIKKQEINNHYTRYKIRYESEYGLKFEHRNDEFDVADFSRIDFVSEEVKDTLEKVYHLKNTEALVFNNEKKLLTEIYKLFYNETPDFSNKDIDVKIQTMMYILVEFGISLGDDYRFSLYGKQKMPFSIKLARLVENLYPFGEVIDVKEGIRLKKEAESVIKIVGECVRETISNEKNQNKALITISKILYARMYCLSSGANISEISEFTKRTSEEVETNIKLVKKIKNKIEDEVN